MSSLWASCECPVPIVKLAPFLFLSKVIAIRLEAIPLRLEVIASRLEAIAIRLEAMLPCSSCFSFSERDSERPTYGHSQQIDVY